VIYRYTQKEKIKMQTLSAKKHQEIMTQKWHDACKNWNPYNGGFPNLAMYGFHRNYGYVTFEGHSSCWRKTKKESIQAFEKMTKK
jgi:hypothetical protein